MRRTYISHKSLKPSSIQDDNDNISLKNKVRSINKANLSKNDIESLFDIDINNISDLNDLINILGTVAVGDNGGSRSITFDDLLQSIENSKSTSDISKYFMSIGIPISPYVAENLFRNRKNIRNHFMSIADFHPIRAQNTVSLCEWKTNDSHKTLSRKKLIDRISMLKEITNMNLDLGNSSVSNSSDPSLNLTSNFSSINGEILEIDPLDDAISESSLNPLSNDVSDRLPNETNENLTKQVDPNSEVEL